MGTANSEGVGCTGCHGRDYGGGGVAGNNGVGLREHHLVNGIGSCLTCHPSDPPALGEDVQPVYYGTIDTNVGDSCNASGLESWSIGDTLGLDNDGDGLYDGDDPDCGPDAGACCFLDGSCAEITEADCTGMVGAWQGPMTICAAAGCPQQGACCFDDGSCQDLLEAECIGMGGDWQGPSTACVAVMCPQPGACCFPDGSCQDLFESECTAISGTWQGPNTACAGVNCAIVGACCLDDGSCQELFEAECIGLGGAWQGSNTACAAVVCDALGACCAPDGSCLELFEADCIGGGGEWQGPNTTCAVVICDVLGACCDPDGSCADVTEDECFAGGGVWQGPVTDCMTVACPQPGVCCLEDGACLDLLELDCLATAGDWQGPGTACAAFECPQPGACCFEDGSCLALFEAECFDANGEWQGPNTACKSVICPLLGACCLSTGACTDVAEFECFELGGDWQGPGTTCSGVICVPPMHPQAVTNCSNCHLDQQTREPDLQGLHGNNCVLCHTNGFQSTFLGPIGTWSGECTECHNPCIDETGNKEEPTKGHRCIVCHGQQLNTWPIDEKHKEHAEETNCVVCHGFIPDVGTEIGSGNRDICMLCHGDDSDEYEDESIETIHRKHTKKGVNCLECHGGERPPVDVIPGPPVGSATVVCDICHSSPEDDDLEKIHEKHTDDRFDCGSCHIDANLQDDRDPMPPLDDFRRMLVDRSGVNECSLCHDDESADIQDIHRKHVADQWQWCYNCHEGDDLRPIGAAPPVTQPADACQLCHDDEQYEDLFPFDIHEEHAGDNKCYACHQATPPLFDWPDQWTVSDDCSSPSCPADFNGDSAVNFYDLQFLLAGWGATGSPADLDGDGFVGFVDLFRRPRGRTFVCR